MKNSNIIFVATLHKCGTVLMKNIFSAFAKDNNLKFINVEKDDYKSINFTNNNIYFDDHSYYLEHLEKSFNYEFKLLQCIRDPRDLLVSATKYHQTSKEKWLHENEDRFNGASYYEMINNLNTFEEKCFFEIQNATYITMENLNIFSTIPSKYKKNITFIKLEDLMKDYDFIEYKRIFEFMNFEEKYLNSFIKYCRNNSIWNISEVNIHTNKHIQHRKSGFWKQELPKSLIDYINYKWPNLIKNLGYI